MSHFDGVSRCHAASRRDARPVLGLARTDLAHEPAEMIRLLRHAFQPAQAHIAPALNLRAEVVRCHHAGAGIRRDELRRELRYDVGEQFRYESLDGAAMGLNVGELPVKGEFVAFRVTLDHTPAATADGLNFDDGIDVPARA